MKKMSGTVAKPLMGLIETFLLVQSTQLTWHPVNSHPETGVPKEGRNFMRYLCAWCGCQLRESTLEQGHKTSHGVCPSCLCERSR